MPIILYCLEALHVSSTACNSFNNCINQAIYKIFEIREKSNISVVREMVGLYDIKDILIKRCNKFFNGLIYDRVFSDILAFSGVDP